MNLKKKTSIWKYIMRLDCVMWAIAATIIFTLPLLGRLVYLIFPSVVFNTFNMPVNPSLEDYAIAGLLTYLAIFAVGCPLLLLLYIIRSVKKHIVVLSVLRAAVPIPLSKDELEENKIYTMDDMTEFLISNVFKDVRHGVRVYEILPELIACYRLVYCDDFKDRNMSEAAKEMARNSDSYDAAIKIIEWLYDENSLTSAIPK